MRLLVKMRSGIPVPTIFIGIVSLICKEPLYIIVHRLYMQKNSLKMQLIPVPFRANNFFLIPLPSLRTK